MTSHSSFRCRVCLVVKTTDQFSLARTNRGHATKCKECVAARSRELYAQGREGDCADCGVYFPYLQRAHVLANHKGGPDDSTNIIMICPNCHVLRDRAERSAFISASWTPERRAAAAAQRAKWIADNPEKEAARAVKIGLAKLGNRHGVGNRGPKGRVIPQAEREARGRSIAATIAAKSPEQRAAHAQKISDTKRSQGRRALVTI